jgi:hypothetical protein
LNPKCRFTFCNSLHIDTVLACGTCDHGMDKLCCADGKHFPAHQVAQTNTTSTAAAAVAVGAVARGLADEHSTLSRLQCNVCLI